jgi:hypothetical protein
VLFYILPRAGKLRTPTRRFPLTTAGGALTPQTSHSSAHFAIMDDFRRGTLKPMLEANSSMRHTIKQSREVIASTHAALDAVSDLARAANEALAVKRTLAATL